MKKFLNNKIQGTKKKQKKKIFTGNYMDARGPRGPNFFFLNLKRIKQYTLILPNKTQVWYQIEPPYNKSFSF